MFLKINTENEKIRIDRRRMKRLNSTYEKTINLLRYYRIILKDCKDLDHRSNCPLCKQKIDYNFYTKQIPELERKIKILEAWIDQNYSYSKTCKIAHPIIELEEIKRKEHQITVESYLKENRNALNKTIRTFELPEINDLEEKKLWNEAIEIQLDNKGMDESDELQFEF